MENSTSSRNRVIRRSGHLAISSERLWSSDKSPELPIAKSPDSSRDDLLVRIPRRRSSPFGPLFGIDRRAGVDAFDRKILAERIAMKAVPGQDATQIGMTRETNSEHVVGLPLRPVGGEKDTGDRGHILALRDAALDADASVLAEGIEVIDDVEAGLPGLPVDRGHVDAVSKVFDFLEMPGHARHSLAGHDDGDLAGKLLGRDDGIGQSRPDRLDP